MSVHDPSLGGLALLFVNVLGEQMGLPIPSYPALLIAGSLARPVAGDAAYLLGVGLIALVACEIADTVWYLVGRRYGGWSMAQVCRISMEPDTCIRKNRNLYLRVGPRLLLVAKLVPGLGALSTLMAGATRTPYRLFLFYDALGSTLWIASGLALGMIFQHAILDALDWLARYVYEGLAVVAIGLALFLAFKQWRRQRIVARSRAVARISAQTLIARQAGGERFQIIDVREPSVVTATLPGALAVPLDTPTRRLHALERACPTVLFCACPNEISAAMMAHRLRRLGIGPTMALIGGVTAWREHSDLEPAPAGRSLDSLPG